jgi:hypothetical protein
MSDSSGSLLSAARVRQPSTPGITTSSVMTAGRTSRARVRPSAPSHASTTPKPSLIRSRDIRSRTSGSSSITSTVTSGPDDGASRASAAAAGRLRHPGAVWPAGRPAEGVTLAGISSVNVEPTPGSLVTVMSPPIMRLKRWLIARPRPVPPYLRVVDASTWEKSRNNRLACSAVMPIPVSWTWKRIQSPPPADWRVTSTSTRPPRVNLPALLRRLNSTWRTRVRSARM